MHGRRVWWRRWRWRLRVRKLEIPECANHQNAVLISMFLVVFCFAEVGVAAVVEDAAAVVAAVGVAAVVAVADDNSRTKSGEDLSH
jgi:hypothetical protein